MNNLLKSVLTLVLLTGSQQSYATTVDFATEMQLKNHASINGSGELQLTPDQNWISGAAFTNTQYSNINDFTATFDFTILGGTNGADGFTFAWITDTNGNTSQGGEIGFSGYTGYAVEFDTFKNSGIDIDNNHIAIDQDSASNSLVSATAGFDINDGATHNAVVEFSNGVIDVTVDGVNYINNYSISGYNAFNGYFGFTSGTGARSNAHIINRFDLTSSSSLISAVPEPSTYALMLSGLGLIGFMARRRKI